jgi:hypothetical protein
MCDEIIDDEKPIREYIKRENPYKYKDKNYYRWYYENVLRQKKGIKKIKLRRTINPVSE